MSPDQQNANMASWEALAADIEQDPESDYWTPWKALARRFLQEGVNAGLHRYFRAGRGMNHFLFSTLDHHGLRDEPRVTVEFHPESELRLAYGTTNLYFQSPELEYSLPFDEGFATFRRFLHQLWSATVPEPIPEDIRSPLAPLIAPVLTPASNQNATSVNGEVTICYPWTADEVVAAHRWHFRHRVRPIFRWAFWLLAALFILIGALQMRKAESALLGGILLIAGLNIPMLLVTRPWLLRRQFAKRRDRNAAIEWRISANSIHIRGAHGTSDVTWAAMAKVVQTPMGFLFYSTEQIFHWLPRHGFASDADFERLAQFAQRYATAFHRCT